MLQDAMQELYEYYDFAPASFLFYVPEVMLGHPSLFRTLPQV